MIAEALTIPSMRFVEAKAIEQIDVQLCIACGRNDHGAHAADLSRIWCRHLARPRCPHVGSAACPGPSGERSVVDSLFKDRGRLEGRIAEITREIERLFSEMTSPGG